MISVLLYVVMALFGLKIGWNLALPYVLAVRMWRNHNAKTGGISLAPVVESVLLVCAFGLSFFADVTWLRGPAWIGLGGLLIMAGSYLHLALAMMVAGKVVTTLKKKRERAGPPQGPVH